MVLVLAFDVPTHIYLWIRRKNSTTPQKYNPTILCKSQQSICILYQVFAQRVTMTQNQHEGVLNMCTDACMIRNDMAVTAPKTNPSTFRIKDTKHGSGRKSELDSVVDKS